MRLAGRRGTTVVEALLALLGFALALGIMALTMQLVGRSMQIDEGASDLHSRCRVALERLLSDLVESTSSDVQSQSGAAAWILFPSPRDAGGQLQRDNYGNLLWQKWICWYLDGSGNLVRTEQPLATPPNAPPASPPTLAAMQSLQPERLAPNIHSVTFNGPLDSLGEPIALQVVIVASASILSQSTPDTQFTVESAIRMLN